MSGSDDDDDEEEPDRSSQKGRRCGTSMIPNVDQDLLCEGGTPDFRFLSSLIPSTTSNSNSTTTTISNNNHHHHHHHHHPNKYAGGSTTSSIPRRGEKDFEPNPTKSQQRALEASRQAMHEALSVERVHVAKNWVVGYLSGSPIAGDVVDDGEGEPEAEAEAEGKGKGKGKRMTRGVGEVEDKRRLGLGGKALVVRIDQPRGVHFRTIGVSDRQNRVWLLPEEALYLIERGSLDIRWGIPGDSSAGRQGGTPSSVDHQELERMGEEEGEGEGEGDHLSLANLPMSLQAAYATFISDDDLTLARYTVFAGLRRSGYTVIRAPTWNDDPLPIKSGQQQHHQHDHHTARHPPTDAPAPSTLASPPPSHLAKWSFFRWQQPIGHFLLTIFHSLFQKFRPRSYVRQPPSCPSLGPLVAPGLHRSYADIFRALTLIPFHDPLSTSPPPPPHLSVPSATSSSTTPASQSQVITPPTLSVTPLRPCYHVYKASTPYRKTSPPPPDFHLAVVDARLHPAIPSLTELGTLFEDVPMQDPKKDEKLKKLRPEMRLKAGTRNVVVAVVDGGVVSFLRMAETGSGNERIYEEHTRRRGGKGGRRGGGGGRGGRGGGRGRGRR